MTYSNFIAALDIGTSNITLTLATRTTTGEINIIDSESTPTTSVKFGKISNESVIAKEIKSLILKVQQRQGTIIEKVFVTTDGAFLQSVTNTVERELTGDSTITSELLKEMEYSNYNFEISDKEEILDVYPLWFKVDGEKVENPEGVTCNKIEADYLIIKATKEELNVIRKTLKIAEIQMADMFLSPLAISKTILTEPEKTAGTVAVEVGQSTTKIAVYQADRLRYVSTIPLGCRLITGDLCRCLEIDKETAITLQKDQQFGAVCSSLVEDADLSIKTISGLKKNYSSRMVVEIIEARVEEIFLNIMHQIERSQCIYLLSGGMVISGSITEIKNLNQFIKLKTNLNTRIADIKPLLAGNTKNNNQTLSSAETCGMLLMGDAICKKEEVVEVKKEEKPVSPKKKRINFKGMGDLFSDLFDEKDEQID